MFKSTSDLCTIVAQHRYTTLLYWSGMALLILRHKKIQKGLVGKGLKWQEHHLKRHEGKAEGWLKEWCSLMHRMFTGKESKDEKGSYLTLKKKKLLLHHSVGWCSVPAGNDCPNQAQWVAKQKFRPTIWAGDFDPKAHICSLYPNHWEKTVITKSLTRPQNWMNQVTTLR